MKIPAKLIEFLNQAGVRYQVLHHPAAFTAQELAAIEGVKGRSHVKVVMVQANGGLSMAVLPSDQRIALEKLTALTGAATALATEAEFKAQFPDCAVGAMPPFGNLYNVPTLVDRSLTTEPVIVFEAGTHTDAIKMSYADFARLAQPQVGDFAVKSH